MEFRAEIVSQQGNEITLKMIDELSLKALISSEYNGRHFAILDTYEQDKITPDQRKHIFALFKDYEGYTGVPLDAVEAYFKYYFMIHQDMDELPSLARNKMTMRTASEFLNYIIDYYIQNGVPFRKQNFYLTTDVSKMLYALIMKRICWVCGKQNAEIAHYEAVGMGRDREKIDHSKHHFMSLCSDCHKRQHQMGIETFMSINHIKPIKLSEADLIELGVV